MRLLFGGMIHSNILVFCVNISVKWITRPQLKCCNEKYRTFRLYVCLFKLVEPTCLDENFEIWGLEEINPSPHQQFFFQPILWLLLKFFNFLNRWTMCQSIPPRIHHFFVYQEIKGNKFKAVINALQFIFIQLKLRVLH